jgi:type I restriction enzyme, S subunit
VRDEVEVTRRTDWSICPLGSICKVIAGQSPQGSAYNDKGEGLPFYQGKKEFTDRYLGAPTTWTTQVTKRAEPHDILMSVRAPVGPINETRDAVCIGRGLAAIRAGERVDRGFLWYALSWLQPKITGSAGAVFPSINRATIESLVIPLPPLVEQKRIVAVLDQAFAALDRARAHAEANLADAKELFHTALNTFMISQTLRYGQIELGHVSAEITDGDHSPPPKAEDGVPFITISNINKEDGSISFSDTFFVPEHYYQGLKEKRRPRVNDVLYTVTGATLGIPALVEFDRQFCFQRHIGLIRPKTGFSGRWVFYALRSSEAFRQATVGSTGAAQKTVSLRSLRTLRIPHLPAEKQPEAAAYLDRIWSKTLHARRSYRQQLSEIFDLRRSILQDAFAGRLTP